MNDSCAISPRLTSCCLSRNLPGNPLRSKLFHEHCRMLYLEESSLRKKLHKNVSPLRKVYNFPSKISLKSRSTDQWYRNILAGVDTAGIVNPDTFSLLHQYIHLYIWGSD